MTKEQLNEYRSQVEAQLREKETEIEKNVSTITIAMLGLFITINEKFIPFESSDLKPVLCISVGSLIISFILSMINKYLTVYFDMSILKLIDDGKVKKTEGEKTLLELWKNSMIVLKVIKLAIYILVTVGLVTQIYYFYFNLNHKKGEIESKIQFEIKDLSKDSIFEKNNIKIYIENNKKDNGKN